MTEQRAHQFKEEEMGSVRLPSRVARRGRQIARVGLLALGVVAVGPVPALAQYNSGSSGAHGAFPPGPLPAGTRYLLWHMKSGLLRYCSAYDVNARMTTCTTEVGTAQLPIPAGGLQTGVFEFTTVDLAPVVGVGALDIYPVGQEGAVPLTILVQGTFRLRAGSVLRLDGAPGVSPPGLPPTGYSAPGGPAGPGGYPGGSGGIQGSPSTNGNPGLGPTGGAGGVANGSGNGFNATLTPMATSLVPLTGGSGGGGGGAFDNHPSCGFRGAGGGGGGGGGAALIAASGQISLEGNLFTTGITANGGAGAAGCSNGGAGSPGSLRLAASTITGAAVLNVGTGTIRIEGDASGYAGPIIAGRGTFLATPQPAFPVSFPTLRITAVGGIAVGPTPSGSIGSPDVTFPTAPTGPVAVDLAASNIPTGTMVNLRATPAIGAATTATSSALAGSAQNATASASLQIPAGAGVITAVTSFPVTMAFLDRLPPIPGITPVRVEVTAEAGGSSRVYLVGANNQRVELVRGVGGELTLSH